METTQAPETPPRRYIAGHVYGSLTVHALAHDPDAGELSRGVYDYGSTVCGRASKSGLIVLRDTKGRPQEWLTDEDPPMKSCHRCGAILSRFGLVR